MGFNRGSIRRFEQERLAKEDLVILSQAVYLARNELIKHGHTDTRIEMLFGKLKRMEKQG